MGSGWDHRSRVLQASRGALAPGLFVRHVRQRNEPRKRGVGYIKRPAGCIRRKKSPGADAPRLASTVIFRVFRVFCGSISSRDWVVGKARAGSFVVIFCQSPPPDLYRYTGVRRTWRSPI